MIEIPGYIFCILVMDCWGRRPILSFCQVINGDADDDDCDYDEDGADDDEDGADDDDANDGVGADAGAADSSLVFVR